MISLLLTLLILVGPNEINMYGNPSAQYCLHESHCNIPNSFESATKSKEENQRDNVQPYLGILDSKSAINLFEGLEFSLYKDMWSPLQAMFAPQHAEGIGLRNIDRTCVYGNETPSYITPHDNSGWGSNHQSEGDVRSYFKLHNFLSKQIYISNGWEHSVLYQDVNRWCHATENNWRFSSHTTKNSEAVSILHWTVIKWSRIIDACLALSILPESAIGWGVITGDSGGFLELRPSNITRTKCIWPAFWLVVCPRYGMRHCEN